LKVLRGGGIFFPRLGRVFSSPLGRNLLYLYLVQGANYLFPLLTLPYLSRVLGPGGFGLLAVGQSLAFYLQLLTDYNFALSGTREVARHREDPKALSRILSGVLGAKLLLVLPAFLLALLALRLPVLQGQEKVVFSALFWAVAWGLSPVWFFQGLERMRRVALLELLTRALATFGVFLLVRGPEGVHLPLLLNGVAALGASLLGYFWLAREVGLALPRLGEAFLYLRLGWSLFFFRLAVSLYTAANPLILSLFVPPAQVGLYAGAERLTKALLGMVEPFNRAFFPRLSHLVHADPLRAGTLGRRILSLMGALGVVGALLVALFAPQAVSLFLGRGYEGSVPLMRTLALLLPLVALSNFLGIQWMLAWGMDRAFNAIIVLGGLGNLLLASLLAHRFGAQGMAWAVVLVEAWVTGAMWFYLARVGKLPQGVRE
jgi:PST family polysaccharide transporter